MLQVHVVPVNWESHREALSSIRQAVFVEEQNIPAEIEFDAEDTVATHLLALDSTGTPLGCARLLTSGLIGRVAVLAKARGNGLGRALIDATVNEAQNQKITRIFLHAQENAESFYKKLEFVSTGARFHEAGIAHVTMERVLPIPFEISGVKKAVVLTKLESETRTSELKEFADEDAAIEQLDTIIRSARRNLRIYSHALDHVLFDRSELVELVSTFVRHAPGTQVELLISDSSQIIARGHLLVELRRRLDQKIQIRKLPDTQKGDAQSWVIADSAAVWVQSEPTEYQGWSDTYNQVQAERFHKRFTRFWDRSISDPELRLLQI